MWLVTGGAGYIGAHVVRALHGAGHQVVVIDMRMPPPGVLPPDVTLVRGSASDVALLTRTMRGHGVTGVMHLAARKSVADSVRDPLHYYQENIAGTLGVLQAMRAAGVRQLVFASSAAVYGAAAHGVVSEAVPTLAMNPYGETKLMCEQIIRDASRAHGFSAVSLRYFNVAGAASPALRDRAGAGLVAIVAEAQRAGHPVLVNGDRHETPDGTCVRDFLHVEDLAQAHVRVAAALAAGSCSPVYNLGSGQGVSVLEVVRAVAAEAGGESRYEVGPSREGDPADVVADIDLARRELGWSPVHDLSAIVADEWRARRTASVPDATACEHMPSRGRIVIFSASVGGGHDGAAREWAARLSHAGYDVDVHDFIPLLPGGIAGSANRIYEAVLHRMPRLYALAYRGCDQAPPIAALVRWSLRGVSRRVAALVPDDAVAAISTYPLASQVLSRLRRRRKLGVPVATFMTDFAAHPFWVAPDVDAHFALHHSTARDAQALGGRGVTVTGPLVPARFAPASPAEQRAAREAFGLPADGALAILVAGSWGVGEVERTARDISATGLATPVVVCGRNGALRERIATSGVGPALGWVSDMAALLKAGDVLVENAGGLSSLEAMASGLPVLSFRPIPGHGVANARRLDAAGVATYVRRADDLGSALRDVLEGERGRDQCRRARRMFGNDPLAAVEALVESDHATRGVYEARHALRKLSVRALVAAILATAGVVTANLAAAAAVHPVSPPSDSSYLVVHPQPDTNFTLATLRMLRDENASIAVDSAFLRQRPAAVQRLAEGGFVLVNAGDGPPYRPSLLDGFVDIERTSAGIHRLTGHRPSFFLTTGRANLTTAAAMAGLHEHLLKPTIQLSADDGAETAEASDGTVILLDCAATCDSSSELDRLDLKSDRGNLRLLPLGEAATR